MMFFSTARAAIDGCVTPRLACTMASMIAAAMLAGAATPAANANDSCSRHVCVWSGVFNGNPTMFGNGDTGRLIQFDNAKYSIRNMLFRKVWTFDVNRDGGLVDISCVEPGGRRGGGRFRARWLYIDPTANLACPDWARG